MAERVEKKRAMQVAEIIDGWPEDIDTPEFEEKLLTHFAHDTIGDLYGASAILDAWDAERRGRRSGRRH